MDPRERHDRADEAPHDLRELLDAELGDLEHRAISDEEEAAIEARLSDLGYL